jgi:hypothetical protein
VKRSEVSETPRVLLSQDSSGDETQTASISESSLSTITNSSRKAGFDENDESVKIMRVHQRALQFMEFLNNNLKALTRSDRTAFNNICDHLSEGCRSGVFNIDIFDKASELVTEARKNGDKPNALFMSLARKFLGYSKKSPDENPGYIENFKSNFGKVKT